MKRNALLALLIFGVGLTTTVKAQDDDFNMDDFAEADDSKIISFCNNKIINLSPTTLIGLSYDVVTPFDMESTKAEALTNTTLADSYTSPVNLNHGLRFDGNFPVISNRSILVNITASYWESRYNVDVSQAEHGLAQSLNSHPLRTSALGVLVFKPLSSKHFMIGQVEAAANGNYNFSDIALDFGAMKYSASLLFGWKYSDYKMLALGVARTYRGGRQLYVPLVLYNHTFNDRWGTELLLPARGHLRYNFSAKSALMFGYELEGQSYNLQQPDIDTGGTIFGVDDPELRKSEIRARLSYSKALSDFIWINVQGGLRVAYRFDLDSSDGADEASWSNNIGIPPYFRFGLNFVSP